MRSHEYGADGRRAYLGPQRRAGLRLLAQRTFYGTNFAKPLLFINDGAYFAGKAQAMGLTGAQWHGIGKLVV